MKSFRASKYFQKITGFDMFGQAVTMNYEGSDTYTSKLSSVVSIGLMTLMAFNLYQLLIGYQVGSKHSLKSDYEQYERVSSEAYYIHETGLKLAIFTKEDYGFDPETMSFSIWQK